MLESTIHEWTHGPNAPMITYANVALPMLAVQLRARSSIGKWLWSMFVAVPLTVIGVLIIALAGFLLSHAGVTGGGIFSWLLSVGFLALAGHGCGMEIAYGDVSDSTSVYRRGAVVSNAKVAFKRQRARRSSRDGKRVIEIPITLAGIPVAAEDETKHFKCVGTTGTGKTTAIREMLSAALARGDRAVVADPDGGYLSHFYDPDRGDVILNPFDPDAVKWNLLGEIRSDHDVDQLARSLIPDSGGSDRIWSGYARTFFTAVVQQVVAARIADDGEIYRLVTKASVQELKLLLAGTVAGPFLEDANDRMFGSVRAVTASAVGALRYTAQQRAAPFSVRQWIGQGGTGLGGRPGGVLFIPYKAGEIAALRSAISAWMRIAIFEAMNRPEGDQRLWFVIDELDALGEIDGLKDALARLRKFGGRCVLGFQSISQVSSTYGKGAADTIVENCGNSLILRCSASEQGGTSQFASRLIGQREVVHTSRSETRRPGEWEPSTTTSEQRTIEPAIMASEIERLPDLTGFLKLASIPDWMRVTLTPVSYPTVARRSRSASDQPGASADGGADAPKRRGNAGGGE